MKTSYKQNIKWCIQDIVRELRQTARLATASCYRDRCNHAADVIRNLNWQLNKARAENVALRAENRALRHAVVDRVDQLVPVKQEPVKQEPVKQEPVKQLNEFQELLVHHMARRNLTQQETASELGISQGTLSRILTRDTLPRPSTMRAIVRRLHLDNGEQSALFGARARILSRRLARRAA